MNADECNPSYPPRRVPIVGVGLLALALAASGCQDSTLPAAARPISPPASSTAFTTTPPEKQPATDTSSVARPAAATTRPQGIREITFDTVKLNMKKNDPYTPELLTPAIKKLDGNRIRVRGYIFPPFQQTGLTRFVLVRDNMACCFGPGAAIYDSMVVDLQPGMTVDYQVSPVAVVGTFNLREVEGVAGKPISIYHLTAEKVE